MLKLCCMELWHLVVVLITRCNNSTQHSLSPKTTNAHAISNYNTVAKDELIMYSMKYCTRRKYTVQNMIIRKDKCMHADIHNSQSEQCRCLSTWYIMDKILAIVSLSLQPRTAHTTSNHKC